MLDYIVFYHARFLQRLPAGIREVLVGLPIVFVICILYWFIRRAWHKKRLGADFSEARRKCRLNELVRLLFVAWFTMMFLLCLTTDPRSLAANFNSPLVLFSSYRVINGFTRFDFIPSILSGLDFSIIKDMILNTVLFIPLGAALPVLWTKADFHRTALVGFLFTYFIEIQAQPLLGRNSSMDDIICNTLGTVIGYLFFMLLRKLFPKFIEKCQITIKIKSAKRKGA